MTHSYTTIPEAKTAAPSAARLAAESAFSVVTATEPAIGGRPAIIVRRKKLAIDTEHDDDSNFDNDSIKATRHPKVYRIDSGLAEGPNESSVEPGAAAASGSGPSQGRDGGEVVGRRRRHIKHGSVTIVRPAPPSARELGERARIAKEQYELLRAEINELDRQIEATRKFEVGEAVRWIREAIAEYGLGAKDLGLC